MIFRNYFLLVLLLISAKIALTANDSRALCKHTSSPTTVTLYPTSTLFNDEVKACSVQINMLLKNPTLEENSTSNSFTRMALMHAACLFKKPSKESHDELTSHLYDVRDIAVRLSSSDFSTDDTKYFLTFGLIPSIDSALSYAYSE